jgi:hypothetical protein
MVFLSWNTNREVLTPATGSFVPSGLKSDVMFLLTHLH